MVYDMHHIFRILLTMFPDNFPSFRNKILKEGKTYHLNIRFLKLLENFHAEGKEEADIMKLLLPLFNFGKINFEINDLKNILKKFSAMECVKGWINNILVLKHLTVPFPSTYILEKIIYKGKFKNIKDALLKLKHLKCTLK